MTIPPRTTSIELTVIDWRINLVKQDLDYVKNPRKQMGFIRDILLCFHNGRGFSEVNDDYHLREIRDIQFLPTDPFEKKLQSYLFLLQAKIFANDCVIIGTLSTILGYWTPTFYFSKEIVFSNFYLMVAGITAVALGIIISLAIARFGNIEGFCQSWEISHLENQKQLRFSELSVETTDLIETAEVVQEKKQERQLIEESSYGQKLFIRLPSKEEIQNLTKSDIQGVSDLALCHIWISLKTEELQRSFKEKIGKLKKLGILRRKTWDPEKVMKDKSAQTREIILNSNNHITQEGNPLFGRLFSE